MKIDYEPIPKPVTTWKEHINFDEAFFERSRRIEHRIWDADGSGAAPPDTTAFVYVETDKVMDTVDDRRMRRITFPVVDEMLPGGHGKIRREFVGEADLNALGLSATNRKHEAERDIRRGLLESETWYDASGGVVRKQETDWRVTTAGTWTGRWQWYYHPGIPQQAYWIRADTLTTTKDGVSAVTVQTHNARNGLVATQTLKSGTHTLRVTETSYHADAVTSSPATLSFGQPVLDATLSAGDRVHAAFLEQSPTQTAKVEAFLNANQNVESTGQYDFASASVSVSGYSALRLEGVLGTSTIQDTGDMEASWLVTVRWSPSGSSVAAQLSHAIAPGAGPVHDPVRKPFDTLIPVPSGASSAVVNVRLMASVQKPVRNVYRKIGITAGNLKATGLSAADAESIFLDRLHILDRPHVVTVKDGSANRLQSARHRYGRFNERGVRIVMPDTTSVWLDEDGDGQVDAGEWIDRQVATEYDAYGNLVESKDALGTVTSTIMGYGKMRPVATFAGAAASKVTAVVFDDYADWTDLDGNAPGNWSKTGTGTPEVADGTFVVNNAVARRSLPANASGVFEIDVMAGAENEQTAVALANGGGTDRIRWVFGSDGTFKALSGTTLTATGASYAANQWYRLKIQWSGSKWRARVDGVRYPASGDYALASGDISRVKLSNGAASGSAAFDNLRAWPSAAQPGVMTTYDPAALDAVAVADENGRTTRFLRDGLRRVVQTIDGSGRVTAQRDHDFSRGISGTSVYNTARPNRQTDIAYRSRDGHKDLSKDGHRTITRGTGDRLEEGVSLETTGSYVVATGETVALKASVGIRLTTGFHAKAGSNFSAGIDPLAGGDGITGSGGITWNQQKAAKRSVKLGPDSALETGRVSGRVTARADFHPASASSGKTVIMAFEDSGDHVRVVYENGSVKLESSMDGTAASSAFVPGYSRSWPWARVEMELLPSGTVTAWLYGHETTRFKGASRSVTVPADWTPAFKATGETGNGYLANLYVGPSEAASTYYDGLARQIQTRTGAGANDVVAQTRYNRVNKPERLLGPVYQAPSYSYAALTDATAGSRITETTYDDDPLLRVSRVIPPGHADSTAVDTRYGRWGTASGPGRSYQTVDDEKGVLTTSVHDAYGRMQYVIADSAGTSTSTRNNKTSFAYDALDRLTSTTLPGGGTSRYAYDTLGRMTSRHHPDADGATLYKYDDLGRMRFSQDARQSAATPARVTFTVYDDFGRVTRVGEATATFSSLDPESAYAFETDNTSWRSRMTYDDGGDAASGGANYAQGRLTEVEENTDADAAAEVTHRYAYDHLGNVRVKKVSLDGLTGDKTVEYTHDLAGRITRLIYPDGAQARYAYDGAGRLARVWDANGNTLTRYTHTAAGNIATHVVGEDVVTGKYTYNLREWVTGLNYAGTFNSTLTYDLAGNVARQVYRHGTAASKTADYAYDDLYRITEFDVTGGVSEDFIYDRSGNIKSVASGGSTLTYNYSPASTPNRLDSTTGTGGQTYAYNQNGWMTRKGADTVAYDYRGLTTGFGSARYLMDPDRRRVKKTVGTSVTYYLRGQGGNVLAEYSGQTLSARYVYAGTRRIAWIAGDSANYYLADHLGSTRSLIDGEGTVTAAYDYWPYGKVLSSSGTGATHFRFTGHERDDESGLDYMLARSYAYDTGRFLRPDPMQDEYPGISPYAYVANNPLRFVDPDGNSHHESQDQYDVNQIIQDRFDEGGVEVANTIANLPGYVESGAQRGASVVAEYSLDVAETSVNSGIVISDALSEGSIAGAAAGTVGVGVGIATRNPALAAGSVNFTYTMLSINTGTNAASTVLKGVDAAAFDGSWEAAYSQFLKTALGSGGSKIAGKIGSRFVARTGSSVIGPMYYNPASGRFVSNRVGVATSAAADATSIGISISVDSQFDR